MLWWYMISVHVDQLLAILELHRRIKRSQEEQKLEHLNQAAAMIFPGSMLWANSLGIGYKATTKPYATAKE